jgi:hydrogenase-4 membrane subunit HyfE
MNASDATATEQTQSPSVPTGGRADDRKGIFGLSVFAGVIGGLCCVTPIVMVLLGIASVSAAADFGNVLYGDYKWAFRGVALACLAAGLVIYFRRRGICSLDQARRERNRIINVALLVLIGSVAMYTFWTYIVVHYWGIAAGLPWAQYDESWAIPAAAILFLVFFLLLWRWRKRSA